MEFLLVEYDDRRVVPLLAGLGDEYGRRYGTTTELALTATEEFTPPKGSFLIAIDGALTVAGGGFRRHSEKTCEIKRMWVHHAYRRRGLAAEILTRLEAVALSVGYLHVVLETGPSQPEAKALYETSGYVRRNPYGPWPRAIAFAKEL
jgi:polar amino acid transport system permease protein